MLPAFPIHAAQPLIALALAEDVGSGDITSTALVKRGTQGVAFFRSREAMCLAGMPILPLLWEQYDASVTVHSHVSDGAEVPAGTVLCQVEGDACALLAVERSALNFIQYLSGIATRTAAFVAAVAGTGTKILDTRKTIPGFRALAKYAVACGGGKNHRFGLHDGVLIKDNHLAIVGGVRPALQQIKAAGYKDFILECDTLEQVDQALEAGAPWLLLDNMSLSTLAAVVRVAKGKTILEASGGITLGNARSTADTGVDYLSIGGLTHSAPAVDIGLDWEMG
ncbi:MAG: carboxylating nicotinate-nucleotide diphosphorylase [Holosporales bacterium]|jgi:nicotinate-nucleotide pyrophosphorylase (carboxylating)